MLGSACGERLATVLATVYLIFNRLGRALVQLLPERPEPHGLLALMLLHDARRDARTRDGELVLLADQDRSLWDAAQLTAGLAYLRRALELGDRGPYVLQPAIAAQHTSRPPLRGPITFGTLDPVRDSWPARKMVDR